MIAKAATKRRKPTADVILAIDPGNVESAYVVYDPATMTLLDKGKVPNDDLLTYRIQSWAKNGATRCVIEMVASYGMSVGADVFETVYWIGRFAQRWDEVRADGLPTHDRIYRKDVKMHLCHNMQAKDGNIRQAVIDLFPATGGGGKGPGQIGTKNQQGPLYGVSKDVWQALALAMTYADKLSQPAADAAA